MPHECGQKLITLKIWTGKLEGFPITRMSKRPEVSQASTAILSSSDSSGHASRGFSYLFMNILCCLLIEDVILAFFF